VGKLDYRRRKNRRYAGINSVTAALENAQSRFDRQRLATCNNPAFSAYYRPESISTQR
jgi:hypothetical protein